MKWDRVGVIERDVNSCQNFCDVLHPEGLISLYPVANFTILMISNAFICQIFISNAIRSVLSSPHHRWNFIWWGASNEIDEIASFRHLGGKSNKLRLIKLSKAKCVRAVTSYTRKWVFTGHYLYRAIHTWLDSTFFCPRFMSHTLSLSLILFELI